MLPKPNACWQEMVLKAELKKWNFHKSMEKKLKSIQAEDSE
jgi:hypothetical protein